MKTKGAIKIKIIKKREDVSPAVTSIPETAVTARQSVRDMTQKVNSWVDEFQQRRDVESTRSFRTLFPAS